MVRFGFVSVGEGVSKGSGTTAYTWFVWDKDAASGTELKWFKPGYKARYG